MSTPATILSLSSTSDAAFLAAGAVAGKRYRVNYVMGLDGVMTMQMIEIPTSGAIAYDSAGLPVIVALNQNTRAGSLKYLEQRHKFMGNISITNRVKIITQ